MNTQVKRIKNMITKDKISWCAIDFLNLYHKKYMDNSEENIHVDIIEA